MEIKKQNLIQKVLKNNQQAIKFALDVLDIARVWDDIVDVPDRVKPESVNRVFWKSLIEIQENPFYVAHRHEFISLFREYMINWMDANDYEKNGTDHEKTIGFVLRDSVGGIVCHCAYILGGYQWLKSVTKEIRALQFDESLDDYLKEL